MEEAEARYRTSRGYLGVLEEQCLSWVLRLIRNAGSISANLLRKYFDRY